MDSLQKFIDETFDILTGLGEMKVAEAIFLEAVDDASQTIASLDVKSRVQVLRQVISLAYQGKNIIKICAHLPQTNNAKKQAHELCVLAHKIDILVNGIASAANESIQID